ncbi:hypothetical protein U8527_09635 [Kordia algicida OT-1]|uniref:Uncharacterized protein n=1 Tax=Kordia algicida OT-1 TaxID=391587 RepID=A9DV25_9FLAO|nr:hypothetical protein [Kordia algicida]EDP96365.1 hypothetical protein KAOT1_03112 [Kordia algicida OT-1]
MSSQKKVKLKQHLSIAKIGKFRFWLGVLLGIFSAVLFFGFIFTITELIDFFRVIQSYDLQLKDDKQLLFEKLFLLALSVAFGNNTMLRFWFSRPTKYLHKTYKYTSPRVVNYALFIEYVVLFGAISFITRFLLFAPFIDLHIFNEYGYVLYLFPVYLFFIAWTEISRYVKSQRWMLKTFACCIVLVILLSFIDVSKYKIGETAFQKMHQEEIEYLEKEVEKATRDYSIEFSEETVNALKELRTKRAFNLLKKTELAFKTEGTVSLDTIIFEKILIHNFKGYHIDRRESYQYIFPFQVYEQLRKVDPKSPEATELLNILAEFYELSLYYLDAFDGGQQSTLNAIKKSTMEKANSYLDHSYHNADYNFMYNQTYYLLYHLQKLGTYNHHPLFEKATPFPPAILFDSWAKEHFPEFKT